MNHTTSTLGNADAICESITRSEARNFYYGIRLLPPAKRSALCAVYALEGTLIAPALAVITIVDPLVGVAIGVSWLGEQVNTSPAVLPGAVVSAAAMIGGIVVLAHRGTRLRHEIERQTDNGGGRP